MCLSSKTIHFPDQWNKELIELDRYIKQSMSIPDVTKQVIKSIQEGHYEHSGNV
jgi:uncharacterized protein YeeX (DUF496 family)